MKEDLLLWLDLETTGSNTEKDCIIEVGAILTTTDLEVLDEFTDLVQPTPLGLGRMLQNEVVREMHQGNGLLWNLLSPATPLRSPHLTAVMLVQWMKGNGGQQGKVVLAGSGVGHFDRRFLAKWMPQVDRFLRHWVIDIGVVRRAHQMWTGTDSPSSANGRKTHRALDDARCHLEEARAFRALWKESS